MPGGNYDNQFDVSRGSVRRLTLSDVVGDAGQASPFGLTIDVADAVQSFEFDLHWDASQLQVHGATAGANLPADWQVVLQPIASGFARVVGFGATTLSGQDIRLVDLDATTASSASYGATGAVWIDQLDLNEGRLSAVGDSSTHVVALLGDSTGNGAHSALDASLAARIAVQLDTGLDAFVRISPVVIADVTGDSHVSALDASWIAQKAAGGNPFLADGAVSVENNQSDEAAETVRLTLSADSPAALGEQVNVRVQGVIGDSAIEAMDLVIPFDPQTFSLNADSIEAGELLAGWTTTIHVVSDQGLALVSAFGPAIQSSEGELLQVRPTVMSETANANGLYVSDASRINEGRVPMEIENEAIDASPYGRLDVSRDGRLNSMDALLLIDHLRRQQSGQPSQATGNMDVNGDSRVNVQDAFVVINALRGQRLGEGEWAPIPVTEAYEEERMVGGAASREDEFAPWFGDQDPFDDQDDWLLQALADDD